MTAAEMPADLTRVRDHSTDPVVDWLDGKREVIDGLAVLDGHVIAETVEFTADPPHPQRYLPPVGWVPIDENIGTPVFASVEADCQPPRTPKGRVSRKPPKLPYTDGVAYQVFVDGSRDDHHSYFHGGRR
jgi:hypothetical protein